MKPALPLFLALTLAASVAQAGPVIVMQHDFGVTAVDVGRAMDIADDNLDDWNTFHYKGIVQALFRRSPTLSWGPELGVNRLYYWEERYLPTWGSRRWRSGVIWTWHMGGVVKRDFGRNSYLLTGASLHTFTNGSGTTLGIPLAVGRTIDINGRMTIPLELRMDVIFGEATPVAVTIGAGLTWVLGE